MTNREMIPGSEHAFTFKTLADAFLLRNHVIERFERADVETDPRRRAQLLTFVVIGGGLVGVELFGELTAFVDGIAPLYKHVNRDEVRFILLQGGDRIMPEIDPKLADYGARVLAGGAGRTSGPTPRCGPSSRARSTWPDETIEAETIVLAAGIVPNPVVAEPARGEGPARAHRGRGDHALPEPPGGVGAGRLRRRSRPRTASPTPAWPSTPCARPGCWPGTSPACSTAGRPSRSSTTPWG